MGKREIDKRRNEQITAVGRMIDFILRYMAKYAIRNGRTDDPEVIYAYMGNFLHVHDIEYYTKTVLQPADQADESQVMEWVTLSHCAPDVADNIYRSASIICRDLDKKREVTDCILREMAVLDEGNPDVFSPECRRVWNDFICATSTVQESVSRIRKKKELFSELYSFLENLFGVMDSKYVITRMKDLTNSHTAETLKVLIGSEDIDLAALASLKADLVCCSLVVM